MREFSSEHELKYLCICVHLLAFLNRSAFKSVCLLAGHEFEIPRLASQGCGLRSALAKGVLRHFFCC